MMNETLITGPSGFLASRLIEVQGEMPVNRTHFYRRSSAVWPDSEGIGKVFHLAALVSYDLKYSAELFQNNVALTSNLCKQYPDARIVYSSSVSVYDQVETTKLESSLPGTDLPYGISKLWGEQFIKHHPSYAVVRFSSLYGPGMKETTLIPRYINQALENGMIEVWGDGKRKQNYLHVDDACGVLLAAMNSHRNGIYLGVAEREWTNLEIAEIIASETGAKIKFIKEDSSPSVSFNNQFTRKTLSWGTGTDIEQGIKLYIKWKKERLS